MDKVIWLGDECEEKLVGGKGYHLSRLKQSFPVPNGFIVSGEIGDNELMESLQKLQKNRLLAVRSSALGEDGSASSFAGMHLTLLSLKNDLEVIKNAIEQCRDSVSSSWANTYRMNLQLQDYITSGTLDPSEMEQVDKIIMPVVIQEMIDPICAGVCFSQHPVTNNPKEIVIESVRGLGEGLVSGAITPDQFIFHKGNSPLEVFFDSENLSPVSVEEGKACLDRNYAEDIAKLVMKVVVASENIPQDIEWAFDGEKIWLLQSRPITTVKKSDYYNDLLSNRTTREVIPNPMTCLCWTAFDSVMKQGLQDRYSKRKVDYKSICKSDNRGFYEIRKGYLYQNLTLTDSLSRAEFGISYKESLLTSFDEIPEELFIECCNTSSIPVGSKIWKLMGILNYLRKTTSSVEEADKQLENYRKKFKVFVSYEDMSEQELKSLWNNFLTLQDEFGQFSSIYIEVQVYLQLFTSAVNELIKKYCPNYSDKPECFNQLLVGLGNVITHQMNIDLNEILTIASEEPKVREYVKNQLSKEQPKFNTWQKELDGTKTSTMLRQFLLDFGHRAACELEVSSPRWGMDPTYLFQLMNIYFQNNSDSINEKTSMEKHVKEREKLEKDIIADCSWTVRSILKWSISKLQHFVRHRENLKDIVVRFISMQQQILFAMVTILSKNHGLHLGVKEDIFHIGINHLQELVKGTISVEDLYQVIAHNKQLFCVYSMKSSPPPVFVGNHPKKLLKKYHGGDIIKGKSGAPGEVIGKAIIIKSLNDAHLLSDSDCDSKILLTSVTDPAWTPLFLLVDGIVVETGGTLSHSAIVAREFGLPCVFDIPGLYSLIEDGSILKVSGTDGTVQCVKEESKNE